MHASATLRRGGTALLAAIAALGVSSTALAEVLCKDLPQPIFGTGGSAPKPVFARLGTALSNANPPETIVYQSPGACYGPNLIITDNPKITGSASYWDKDGKEQKCTLSAPDGDDADFGIGGTYPDKCPDFPGLPADVGDFLGPIQPYVFIANKNSAETSISAEAAYFVYGFGADGQAAPWTDEAAIIKRDPNSGAAIAVAIAIGVPVGKFKGVDAGTNAKSVNLVATSLNPQGAIGFCSGETAEAALDSINILAYQHYGQTCGYWPSSTSTSFDKQNVRDGHYALWAPLHYFAKIGNDGKPSRPGAKRLLGYLDGSVAPPAGVDVLKEEIAGGAVPECAMRVSRSEDIGPLASYAPADPCGCYFDFVATGKTSCDACAADGDCKGQGQKCRHGYCEEY